MLEGKKNEHGSRPNVCNIVVYCSSNYKTTKLNNKIEPGVYFIEIPEKKRVHLLSHLDHGKTIKSLVSPLVPKKNFNGY